MTKKTIQRCTQEKELQMAQPWGVGIRDDMVAAGMECWGTLSMAAQAGYYTPRACEKMGQPVGADEVATHCAIMANCDTELCLIDAEGNRVRPCLPVFPRPRCRVCGYTEDHACPGGCWWVEKDLCSVCAQMEKGQGGDGDHA